MSNHNLTKLLNVTHRSIYLILALYVLSACSGVESKNPISISDQTPVNPVPDSTSDAKPLSGIKSISASGVDACALTNNGSVYCWGNSNLGNGVYPHAGKVQLLSQKVKDVSTGSMYACAKMEDNTLECWGKYPMRDPDISTAAQFSKAEKISGVADIDKIFSTNKVFCFTQNSNQYCWGSGTVGELGNGYSLDSTTPVPTNNLHDPITIAQWDVHSLRMGINSLGYIRWWGSGTSLLTGSSSSSNTPIAITAATGGGHLGLAVGYNHACAIDANKSVKCWGSNSYGELGNGTTTNSLSLVQATGLTAAFKQIVAGYNFACALNNMRQVYCWGRNNYGTLGDGTTIDSLSPKLVSSLNTFSTDQIVSGRYFVCVRSTTGEVKCWGQNPSSLEILTSPTEVKYKSY